MTNPVLASANLEEFASPGAAVMSVFVVLLVAAILVAAVYAVVSEFREDLAAGMRRHLIAGAALAGALMLWVGVLAVLCLIFSAASYVGA